MGWLHLQRRVGLLPGEFLRFLVASAHMRDLLVHGKYLLERAKDLLKRANRTLDRARIARCSTF
jgi:hypothetical protein